MMKGYRSMAHRFHPDNNYGFDTTEIIAMINTARDGLRYQLRENDELRGEELVLAAEDASSISSHHNSDSESSGTSSEPASSHPRPWTSKKSFKKSRIYMSGVMATITLNSCTYCLQDGYIYLNLTILATQFMKNFKMQAVRQCSFLLSKI